MISTHGPERESWHLGGPCATHWPHYYYCRQCFASKTNFDLRLPPFRQWALPLSDGFPIPTSRFTAAICRSWKCTTTLNNTFFRTFWWSFIVKTLGQTVSNNHRGGLSYKMYNRLVVLVDRNWQITQTNNRQLQTQTGLDQIHLIPIPCRMEYYLGSLL